MSNVRAKIVVLSVSPVTKDGKVVAENIRYREVSGTGEDSFTLTDPALFGQYKVDAEYYYGATLTSAATPTRVEASPGTPGFDNKVAAGEVEASGSGTKEQNANANVKTDFGHAETAQEKTDRLAAGDFAARRPPLVQAYDESDADFAARQRAPALVQQFGESDAAFAARQRA